VPEGPPVQLDGRVTNAEWHEAAIIPLSMPGTQLRLRQSRGMLLLAFEADRPWPSGAQLHFHFAPVLPAKGNDAPSEDATTDMGAWTDGAVSINWEPLHHDRPHLLVTRQDGKQTLRQAGGVLARSVLVGSTCSAEFALRPALFAALPKGTTALRFFTRWTQAHANSPPAMWPEGVDMTAQPGRPPAGIASAADWGTLRGLTLRGHGAISGEQWDVFKEEDRLITSRGEGAHTLLREMREEKRSFLKQDDRVEEEIFAAFRWIAAREPLSPRDLLAWAQALRQINRYDAALAMLEALATGRDEGFARSALYEQAQVLELRESYEEAAARWEALADRLGAAQQAAAYRRSAKKAREKAVAHARELEARATDDARTDNVLIELQLQHGSVVLQLWPHDTPEAVKHFTDLVRKGFYDGHRFHRVIGEFLAQTGDPVSKAGPLHEAGSGSSETTVPIEENRRHGFWRGAVGFAVGMKQANGSQFFILTGPKPDLIEQAGQSFTCFGRVLSGMAVVDRIAYGDRLIRARVLGGG
jgi:cyclophilin family peptidyl-prolyl cis-trans isomerase